MRTGVCYACKALEWLYAIPWELPNFQEGNTWDMGVVMDYPLRFLCISIAIYYTRTILTYEITIASITVVHC